MICRGRDHGDRDAEIEQPERERHGAAGWGHPTSRPEPAVDDRRDRTPTREGKLDCCVVLDAFSRRIVGWSLDRRPTAAMVNDALGMAIEGRKRGPITGCEVLWLVRRKGGSGVPVVATLPLARCDARH